MKESEMLERGFTANDDGLVLDEYGNEYRDEEGQICFVEPDIKSIFDRFMALRFPGETDQCYINEWRRRFNSGSPDLYMDSLSKACYIRAIDDYMNEKYSRTIWKK